jgi:hypothetical protein
MRRFLPFVLASAVLLAGCSDTVQSPVAPAEVAPNALIASAIDLSDVVQFASVPNLLAPRRAERFIRASEGGSVELNGFRIDIPAGALPHDATISIELPTDPFGAKHVMAEFGPHGIQFNAPVRITFPLSGVVGSVAGIGVARWENGGWTPLGGTLSADGRSVWSTTPHFSTYAARKDMMAGG